MKSMRSLILFSTITLFLFSISSSAYALYQDLDLDYVPGELIISFEIGITESDIEDLANEFNFSVIRKLRLRNHNTYLVKIGHDQTELSVINQLAINDDVLYSELNGIIRIPETWPCFSEIIGSVPINDGGQLNLEDIEHLEFQLMPKQPRLNLLLDTVSPLNTYNLSTNSYGLTPPAEGISPAITVVPEPATIALLTLGAIFLRRRK